MGITLRPMYILYEYMEPEGAVRFWGLRWSEFSAVPQGITFRWLFGLPGFRVWGFRSVSSYDEGLDLGVAKF